MNTETIRAKIEAYTVLAATKADRMAAAGVAHDALNATIARHHHELIEARNRANQASNDHEQACQAERKLVELRRDHPEAFQS